MLNKNLNGLYTLNYQDTRIPTGSGNGVAFIVDNKIVGGDALVYFEGEIIDNQVIVTNRIIGNNHDMYSMLPEGRHIFTISAENKNSIILVHAAGIIVTANRQ